MSTDPNEWVLARFRDQLAETTDVETAIAAMPEPRVPDGGRAEEWVKPQLERATSEYGGRRFSMAASSSRPGSCSTRRSSSIPRSRSSMPLPRRCPRRARSK